MSNGLPAWARRVVARGVSEVLTVCVRRAVEAQPADEPAPSAEPVESGEFFEAEPTCRFAVPAESPRLTVWFSPSLADALLDVLLGGDGRTDKPRGPLTALDRQLLCPLVERIAGSLAFESPMSADDGATLCAVMLHVRLGGGPLSMHVVWPRDARAVTEALLPRAEEVDVVAEIHETVDRDALADLSDGDLLVSDVAPDGEIHVTLNGVPRFAATLGLCNGKRAITITRRL